MRDVNAAQLLAKVMEWREGDTQFARVRELQLLAEFKYDQYQRFGPGRRFVESLALWLRQFDPAHRSAALKLVADHLVFISNEEFVHLVQTAYQDVIVQEQIRLVAEELNIPRHRVGRITREQRYRELKVKSLYLGLSDGSRTNELRRFSEGGINNEQIWQAYELGDVKSEKVLSKLTSGLKSAGIETASAKFNLIWLLDDFSGSGNTYIRRNKATKEFDGKIPSIYSEIHKRGLVDPSNYEVFLLLYVATQQAIEHIEYWSERYTSDNGYKPLQIRVLCPISHATSLKSTSDPDIRALLAVDTYYDSQVDDRSMRVGGSDGRLGFADCALPVVLSHNSPNNSLYVIWGPEDTKFPGLFPRVSRHREA